MGFSSNLTREVELISAIAAQVFPRQIFIKDKNKVMDIAKNNRANLTLQYNGSKLDQERTEAAVIWKENRQSNECIIQKISLGKNKEIFNTKM